MLIFHENIEPEGEIGIWEIREDEEYFLSRLTLTPAETEQLSIIKGHRRLEWLSARHLLHQMSGREVRGEVLKDEFGKPQLEHSTWHISMSHSHNHSAIIASPILNGIDIQFFVDKIGRIAHRFLSEKELGSVSSSFRIEHLHVFWGAKEALYKAYGRRSLDFSRDIVVLPFDYNPPAGKCEGIVSAPDMALKFDIFYKKMGDFMLVWALKKNL